MRKTWPAPLVWFLFAGCAAAPPSATPAASTSRTSTIAPPIAERIPEVFDEHGRKREDPYFWLRQRENPKVIEYLEAENRYTEAMLKPAEAVKHELFAEMKARVKEDDVSVPYKLGDYEYWWREEKGKEYKIHQRRRLG